MTSRKIISETPFSMKLSDFNKVATTNQSAYAKSNFNYVGHTPEYYKKEYGGFNDAVYELLSRASKEEHKIMDMTDNNIKKSVIVDDEFRPCDNVSNNERS